MDIRAVAGARHAQGNVRRVVNEAIRESNKEARKYRESIKGGHANSVDQRNVFVNNAAETSLKRETYILSFMLLGYVFTVDDGEIDKSEEKVLKKLMKQYIKVIGPALMEQLASNESRYGDKYNLIRYVNENHFTLDDFNKSLSLISKQFKKKAIYIEKLKQLRSEIYES